MLALAAAASWALSGRGAARTTSGPAVNVVSALKPRLSDAAVVPAREGRTGAVRFVLPPAWRVTGVETARLLGEREGVPSLEEPCDVVTAQVDGALDLRTWLAAKKPSGERFLQFLLRVEGPEGPESWAGWTRFRAADLLASNVEVTPRRGERTVLEARLAGGQHVPGALVTVDVYPFQAGFLSLMLATDADGTRAIAGLDAGSDLRARLPEGVGPDGAEVEVSFRPPAARVVLESKLGATWEFVEHAAVFPAAGAALRIEDLLPVAGRVPTAWPVSRWIGAGRGPRTPLWTMHVKDAAVAPAVELRFADVDAVRLEDARVATELVFPRGGTKVSMRPLPTAPR